jgi:hypothetical protein
MGRKFSSLSWSKEGRDESVISKPLIFVQIFSPKHRYLTRIPFKNPFALLGPSLDISIGEEKADIDDRH